MKPECKKGQHQMQIESTESIYKKWDWSEVPKPIGTITTFKCKHCEHQTQLADKS